HRLRWHGGGRQPLFFEREVPKGVGRVKNPQTIASARSEDSLRTQHDRSPVLGRSRWVEAAGRLWPLLSRMGCLGPESVVVLGGAGVDWRLLAARSLARAFFRVVSYEAVASTGACSLRVRSLAFVTRSRLLDESSSPVGIPWERCAQRHSGRRVLSLAKIHRLHAALYRESRGRFSRIPPQSSRG
ncbi:MAG: hypothetical protein RLZZ450_7428, partial [Pseudomonadota bacterium]